MVLLAGQEPFIYPPLPSCRMHNHSQMLITLFLIHLCLPIANTTVQTYVIVFSTLNSWHKSICIFSGCDHPPVLLRTLWYFPSSFMRKSRTLACVFTSSWALSLPTSESGFTSSSLQSLALPSLDHSHDLYDLYSVSQKIPSSQNAFLPVRKTQIKRHIS